MNEVYVRHSIVVQASRCIRTRARRSPDDRLLCLMSFTFDSRFLRETIRLFLSELKAFANLILLYSFLVSTLGNCLFICKIYGYYVFNLQIFALAESFGATESLVEIPYDVLKAIAFNNNDSLCSICLL